ncbi:MAG: FtsX-like permease family protein [Planctomycetota bacterium]
MLRLQLRFVLATMLHARKRTALAVAGVAAAVFLIFLELTIHSSVVYTSGALTGRLAYDLAIVPSGYRALVMSTPFHQRRLSQALAVEGVASAAPLYRAYGEFKAPGAPHDARVLLLAFRPEDRVFPQLGEETVQSLYQPGTIAFDRCSQRVVGDPQPGMTAICNRRRVLVGQHFELGAGFAAPGLVLMSRATYASVTRFSLDDVQFGLLRLVPGADRRVVQAELRRQLPDDVLVLDRDEVEARQRLQWETVSSSGKITRSGVAFACAVALIVLLQVMSSDVLQRLAEYATLAALGYGSSFVTAVVALQGLLMGAAGYALGLGLALPVRGVLAGATKVPNFLSARDCLLVLAAVLGASLLSGMFALEKLRRADPAELF